MSRTVYWNPQTGHILDCEFTVYAFDEYPNKPHVSKSRMEAQEYMSACDGGPYIVLVATGIGIEV